MSEVQKPVEETPVAVPAVETPAEATAATEAPATEAPKETPAETTEAAATETPAAATEAPAEEPKEEAKEVTPATDGVLGHKAPGLVKGLRFAKRYFYFSEEPVEAKNLAAFHQNEKPAVANPIAAWASQTGKGLLFIAKRAEDKATPAGILNLADATDLTKEGTNEVIFKINGQKHTIQAASAEERDSWYAALEAKVAEAKAEKETVTSSEAYKAELEKLSKPVAGEAAAKDEAAPTEEDKAAAKSRSQSRKRVSIFGTLLGKKEETEEKEDKADEAKPAEAAAESPAESAPAAEASTEAAPATEVADKEDKKEEKKAKRASLFGNFFQKVTSPSHEKTEKEATAPAETTAVSSTAPQLENPVEEAAVKPIEPESVTAPADAEAAKDATAAPAESPAAEAPVSPTTKDKRRTSFFGTLGIKKEKKGETSDNEATEGEAKPKNKLGGLFRKPSKAVKSEEKKEEKTEENKTQQPEPVKEAEEPAAEEPAKTAEAAAPVTVASTSTPVQAAA